MKKSKLIAGVALALSAIVGAVIYKKKKCCDKPE